MGWRRVGYGLLALAYALAIYGHNAFGMTMGTVASVIGLVGFLVAFRWPFWGVAVAAAGTAVLVVVYAVSPNVSATSATAIAVIAAGIAAMAFARLKEARENVELIGAAAAFVANLWFVWSNVIANWTPEFAFVNMALGLGVASVGWAAASERAKGRP